MNSEPTDIITNFTISMTRWLVAYDGSKDADIAAHCAVDLMDKQKDELILFTAFEDVIQPWVFPYGSSAIPILLESQRNMESEFKKKAADMVSKCKQQGVVNSDHGITFLRSTVLHYVKVVHMQEN